MDYQLNYTTKTQNCALIPAKFLNFLFKKLHLFDLFANNVKDMRAKKGRYSIASLLMCALQMILFRFPSKNDFYQNKKDKRSYRNFAKLAHIEEDRFPHSKTIDDAIWNVDAQDVGQVLFDLFSKLKTSKRIHPSLKKTKCFRLCIDAFCPHAYTPQSQHPAQSCPHCLKREKENGKMWYLHTHLVASLVFDNGLQIPLCCYFVRKEKRLENLSTKALKQECEQTALPHILAVIRENFPKLKMEVLLDGLYANQTSIGVLKDYNFEYSIVLKRLKSVQESLDTIDKKTRKVARGRFNCTQVAAFTNNIPYAKQMLHAIEFDERGQKKPSRRFAKIESYQVHYQWIFSEKINEESVFEKADGARKRWFEEDLFNSLKNRGFSIKHDWSRHPNSQKIWFLLTLIAYALCSIFLIFFGKTKMTLKAFFKQMFYDLLYFKDCLCGPYQKNLRFSLWIGAG
jgi:hypothetical protein